MNKRNRFTFIRIMLAALLTLSVLSGCGKKQEQIQLPVASAVEEYAGSEVTTTVASFAENETSDSSLIDENGSYSSKEDVALYIHTYNKLPSNFITKVDARKLGWSGGSLEEYAPGMSIGGDYFGNFEGKLPEADGRFYQECDIDTRGEPKRGAKRIVFSNDGLIFYTEDHYFTFEQLY